MRHATRSFKLMIQPVLGMVVLYLALTYEIAAMITFALMGLAVLVGIFYAGFSLMKYVADHRSNPSQNYNYHKTRRNFPWYNAFTITTIGILGVLFVMFEIISGIFLVPSAVLALVLPIFFIATRG